MKDNRTGTLTIGTLLVVIGVLFLLQNFNVFGSIGDFVWMVLFGAGGLAFLYVREEPAAVVGRDSGIRSSGPRCADRVRR